MRGSGYFFDSPNFRRRNGIVWTTAGGPARGKSLRAGTVGGPPAASYKEVR